MLSSCFLLHQADYSGWTWLQFQWDRSLALRHRPVHQHPHFCRWSQLPCSASPRGECAHSLMCVCRCMWLSVRWQSAHLQLAEPCSLTALCSGFLYSFRWGTGRMQLCCSYIPTSWSLYPRRWVTCRSSRSSISATTSEFGETFFDSWHLKVSEK